MNNKLGTKWVAPGEGDSMADLRTAAAEVFGYLKDCDKFNHNPGRLTNLALTGEPMTQYDIERMIHCDVRQVKGTQNETSNQNHKDKRRTTST